jgi:hypothetical protein
MKQNITFNGAAVPAATVVTKSVFSFKVRPVIAPKGLKKATWVSAVNESSETGDVNRVVATVRLQETDLNSQPIMLTKSYDVRPNKRGANMFLDDYNAWTRAALTADDLYESFDGQADNGKELMVEVGHRKIGKLWEAFIKSFLPIEQETVAAPAATTEPVN